MTDAEMKADVLAHWKRMARDPLGCYAKNYEAPHADYCAFCIGYAGPPLITCCGCPVFRKTQRRVCVNTPYYAAQKAWDHFDCAQYGPLFADDRVSLNTDPVRFVNAIVEWRRCARAVIDFVRDLEV